MMPSRKASTKQVLRADLMRKGKSLRSFAIETGHPYPAVISAVNRYWGNDKQPRAIQTSQILLDLESETSEASNA